MDEDQPIVTPTSPEPRPVSSSEPGPEPGPEPGFAASPTPSPKRTWRNAAILGGVAFVAGLIAMALTLHYFPGWFAAKPTATVTLPLATTAGGKTPVVIVPGTGSAPTPTIDLDALSAREAELTARLSELEARTANVGTESRVAAGYATRAEGLMIAFAARRQIDRGQPLGYIEEQLHDRFGSVQPQAVGTIIQAAGAPVTIEDLRVGLDAIAPELATGAASGGWLASFRRELGNLIVLHRAETPSPLPAERLGRARRMLQAGQVEAALAEVARMPGAAEGERWIAAARRYIGARQALDTIEAAALQGQASVPARPAAPAVGATPPSR